MKFSMFCVLFQAPLRCAERFISYHPCRTLSTTFLKFFKKVVFRPLQRLFSLCNHMFYRHFCFRTCCLTRQLVYITKDSQLRQALFELFSNLLRLFLQLRKLSIPKSLTSNTFGLFIFINLCNILSCMLLTFTFYKGRIS